MAKRANGRKSDQSISDSTALASMGLRVPCNLSTTPFDCGLYGEEAILSIPNVSQRPDNNLPRKMVPLSDSTLSGIPVLLMISKKHWAASEAEAVRMGTASGHLVARHT